jgi:hypothetical protein
VLGERIVVYSVIGGGGGSDALISLSLCTDVDVTTVLPENDQVLFFDTTTEK